MCPGKPLGREAITVLLRLAELAVPSIVAKGQTPG
jgi:hypothetical protein